jgi:hypothetical protein
MSTQHHLHLPQPQELAQPQGRQMPACMALATEPLTRQQEQGQVLL